MPRRKPNPQMRGLGPTPALREWWGREPTEDIEPGEWEREEETSYPRLAAGGELGEQIWEAQTPLGKTALATALIPGVGDVMGLAADVEAYTEGDLSVTPGNLGLSTLGLLPFMPGAAITKPRLQAQQFGKGKTTKRALADFNEALGAAHGKMDPASAAQVDPRLAEDFSGSVFMTPKGEAGFSMTPEGYVGNLFKQPDAPYSDVMGGALTRARAGGGKMLEAFDVQAAGRPSLVDAYVKRGAEERFRGDWDPRYGDPELAPYAPDYVGMEIGGYVPERRTSLLAEPMAQTDLPRTQPPRGEPKSVPALFNEENVARLEELADFGAGRKIRPDDPYPQFAQRGERWYWLQGLRDRFIEELGPVQGEKRFNTFVELNAGMSPRSAVDTQLKRSSILEQRLGRGQSISPLSAEMFPPGYGHLATTTAHRPGISRLMETGRVGSGVDQPKVAAYAENMRGNYRPVTVDTHNYEILSSQKKSPTAAQYPFLEARQQQLAASRGEAPAEWQSSLWVGANDITGVRDPSNLSAQLNRRLAQTATDLGISEAEAFRLWARQQEHLR